jgi:uncharacterized protein
VIVPALVILAHMDLKNAVGTSLLVITLVSISAISGVILTGDAVPARVATLFLVGSLSGMAAGTILAKRIGGPKLQKGFAIGILGVAAWVIAKNLISI